MTRYSKAEFYFAGCSTAQAREFLSHRLRHLEGWTLIPTIGGWKGETEHAFKLEIIAPSDTPARYSTADIGVLVPAEVNSIETEARDIAEAIAHQFNQEAVAYSVSPVALFALTTVQATYRRNGG